jgi:phage terminase small subunit
MKGRKPKPTVLKLLDGCRSGAETMRKLLVEFGLTPSSRSRIRIGGADAAGDEFDQFLGAG